jgi:lysophospholipid acyltransferase (LPLAT)-like uncharacterized protein
MPRRPEELAFRLAVWLGGWLGAWCLRLLGASWRVAEEGEDPLRRGRAIGASWHRGFVVAAWRFRGVGLVIPVSRSRDGDRIAAVLGRLGYGPSPRGSTSRGGAAALAGMLRAAAEGRSIGVLCDGPRGPARRCKPGVVLAARETGLDLHAFGVAARPALVFGSWDRALLPLPFARVRLVIGPPLAIPREASREELDAWCERVGQEIDRAQARAEAALGSVS